MDRNTDKETDRQIDGLVDRQADSGVGRQTGRLDNMDKIGLIDGLTGC